MVFASYSHVETRGGTIFVYPLRITWKFDSVELSIPAKFVFEVHFWALKLLFIFLMDTCALFGDSQKLIIEWDLLSLLVHAMELSSKIAIEYNDWVHQTLYNL